MNQSITSSCSASAHTGLPPRVVGPIRRNGVAGKPEEGSIPRRSRDAKSASRTRRATPNTPFSPSPGKSGLKHPLGRATAAAQGSRSPGRAYPHAAGLSELRRRYCKLSSQRSVGGPLNAWRQRAQATPTQRPRAPRCFDRAAASAPRRRDTGRLACSLLPQAFGFSDPRFLLSQAIGVSSPGLLWRGTPLGLPRTGEERGRGVS